MQPPTLQPLFVFTLERNLTLSLKVSFLAILVIIGVVLAVWLTRYLLGKFTGTKFQIDTAELGLGSSRISFKPNNDDQQIAYKIWVELSTRKIGIPIDLDHDVISEVYDSWYGFFSITREMIKDIPVNKVKHDSTRKVITLSINVLNQGLRPHLTSWQSRFRHWYDRELKKEGDDIDPQAIQQKYPKFEDLKNDMLLVNDRLIKYREKMRELVLGLEVE